MFYLHVYFIWTGRKIRCSKFASCLARPTFYLFIMQISRLPVVAFSFTFFYYYYYIFILFYFLFIFDCALFTQTLNCKITIYTIHAEIQTSQFYGTQFLLLLLWFYFFLWQANAKYCCCRAVGLPFFKCSLYYDISCRNIFYTLINFYAIFHNLAGSGG